jgi:hypothetical protein
MTDSTQAPTPPPEPSPEASTIFYSENGKKFEIREVWASNLDQEMKNIREVVEKYPFVAMVSTPATVLHCACV